MPQRFSYLVLIAFMSLAGCGGMYPLGESRHPSEDARAEKRALVSGYPVTAKLGTPPTTIPGTLPLAISDPAGEPFYLYGACGSYENSKKFNLPECLNIQKTMVTLRDPISGMTCSYKQWSCGTHSFCRFHDRCYFGCDAVYAKTEEGKARGDCYRECDASCLTGAAPATSFNPRFSNLPYVPGFPEDERQRAPAQRYSTETCATWAKNAGGEQEGVLIYSEIESATCRKN